MKQRRGITGWEILGIMVLVATFPIWGNVLLVAATGIIAVFVGTAAWLFAKILNFFEHEE